jgi:hypothetical protein
MQQDRWHTAAGTMNVQDAFPFSLELESSVGEYTFWAFRLIRAFADETCTAVLRGHVRTNFHCYTPHDMESILRLADEFGFKVHAFHHANDAHLIPDILKGSARFLILLLL